MCIEGEDIVAAKLVEPPLDIAAIAAAPVDAGSPDIIIPIIGAVPVIVEEVLAAVVGIAVPAGIAEAAAEVEPAEVDVVVGVPPVMR